MRHDVIPVPLSSEERQRLGLIADVLIPGGAGLPSASNAGVTTEPIDRVISADPQMSATLAAVVWRDGSPESVVEELRAHDRSTYERLVFAVSGAYFMVPHVRRSLGYPGIAPRRSPAAADESDFYLEGEVLQPVIDRGSIYREAP